MSLFEKALHRYPLTTLFVLTLAIIGAMYWGAKLVLTYLRQ